MTGNSSIVPLVATAALAGVALALLWRQYKRCPEGKLLVVYGARLPDSIVVLDSGGRFVLPLLQDSAYLSLEEIVLPEYPRVGYPRAVRIGTSTALRRRAVIHFLGLSPADIVVKVQELFDELGPGASPRSLQERLAELGLESA